MTLERASTFGRAAGLLGMRRQPRPASRPRRDRPIRAARRARRVQVQSRVYLRRLTWIAADLTRHFPLRIVAVTAFYAFGVGSGAAAIGSILLFAQHLADHGPVLPGPWAIEGSSAIAIMVGLVGVLGIGAAVCIYVGEWAIGCMAVAYQRECERRLFRIVGDPGARGWAGVLPGPAIDQLQHLRSFGCKVMALSARRLMRVVLPAIVLPVAAAAVLITDWRLALLLLPLAVAYLGPLYLINRGAARAQRRFTAEAAPLRQALRRATRDAVEGGASRGETLAAADAVLDDPRYFRNGLLFFRRKLLPQQTLLLNTTFFVLAIMVVLLYGAVQTGAAGWSWSRLLAFLVALRVAVGSMKQVTAIFVLLSRFFPEYRRYIEFVTAADRLRRRRQRAADDTPPPLDTALVLRCPRPELAGSVKRLTLDRPGPLWVLLPWSPELADLEAVAARLQRAMRGPGDLLAASQIPGRVDDVDDVDPDQHRDWFEQLGVLDELRPLLDDPPASYESLYDALGWEADWAWNARHFAQRGEIAFIGIDALDGLAPGFIERLAQALADRYVVLVTSDPAAPLAPATAWGEPDAARVLVLGAGKVLGAGDLAWLAEHADPVRERLAREEPIASGDDLELEES
ncbi:MAG: hypothetical protein WD009_03695 [Phycisphaeraceae bacterium]